MAKIGYNVLLDRNKNACIDIKEFDSSKIKTGYTYILRPEVPLDSLARAIARARIMGRNPKSIAMYTNGKNPKILNNKNDDWQQSNDYLYALIASTRYKTEPLFQDLRTYFDDSELANLHEDTKKEIENRRERFRRGAY